MTRISTNFEAERDSAEHLNLARPAAQRSFPYWPGKSRLVFVGLTNTVTQTGFAKLRAPRATTEPWAIIRDGGPP